MYGVALGCVLTLVGYPPPKIALQIPNSLVKVISNEPTTSREGRGQACMLDG
jgi:hypothetical protein